MIKEQNVQTSLILDDYISFKTECDCYSHDLKVTFKKDEFGCYQLMMNDQVYIDELYDKPFLSRMWFRIKCACQMLFRGYIEFDYEFIFKGKEHIEEFLRYINDSYKQIKEKENENQK